MLGGAVLVAILVTVIVSACDPNCATVCIQQTYCDGTCKPLWGVNYYAVGHPCGACEPLCLSACNIKGPGTCDKVCVTGYCVEKVTYHCIVKEHCTNCTNGYPICTSCESPYFPYQGNCSLCCDNCTVGGCTIPGTCNKTKCVSPEFGWVLLPGSTTLYCCGRCDPHCIGGCTTKGAGKCDAQCEAGYGLNPTFNCVACDANCAVPCTDAYTCPPGGCIDPGYGSMLLVSPSSQTTCSPCDVNCAGSCNVKGGGKCDATCKTGYALVTATYTCGACSSHCLTTGCAISGAGFCDCPCDAGYVCATTPGDATKKACYPCADHCVSPYCPVEGRGCCDSTCAVGWTWTFYRTGCHVCVQQP